MFSTVLGVLMTNEAVWNSVLKMLTAVTTLKGIIASIFTVAQIQEQSSKGITIDKGNLRTFIIDKMMLVIGGLKALAKDTNNEQLFKNVNVGEGKLKTLSESRFITKVQFIIDLAVANIADLPDYNVTDADVTSVTTDAAAYVAIMPKTRENITLVKNATEQLNALVKKGITVLELIDSFMLTFKKSNADFYAQYKDARKVIDSGVRHNKFTGKVVKGNAVVSGASLKIVGEDKSGMTAWNGEFEIEGVHTGKFDVIVNDGTIEKTIHNLTMRRGTDLNYVIDLAA